MLKISKPYSVKRLNNGASRVYVSSPDLIRVSGFQEGQYLTANWCNGSITVTASSKATEPRFKLLNTSRGLILELRSKNVTNSLSGIGRALVQAKKGSIKIVPHPTELKRLQRENRFVSAIRSKRHLDRGSLFSGLGLLSAYLGDGLHSVGIKSRIRLVNDICPAALTVNTQSNPMWSQAHPNAEAVCADIRELLTTSNIPQLDIMDISYPCNGQSTLINSDQRDIQHKVVGDLFIDTVAAIRASNPALMIMECTPAFLKSDTLRLMKQALSDYVFHDFQLSGAKHGEIENRPRVAVVAISQGIAHLLPLSAGVPVPAKRQVTPVLSEFLEDVAPGSDLWREFKHVTNKIDDERLDFKHTAYTPDANKIATLIATYASPKIGSPFLAHPSNPKLMRMFTVAEHANIKRLAPAVKQHLIDIEQGNTTLTSARGSKSLAHKLMGMSVNRYPWTDLAAFVGTTIIENIVTDGLF